MGVPREERDRKKYLKKEWHKLTKLDEIYAYICPRSSVNSSHETLNETHYSQIAKKTKTKNIVKQQEGSKSYIQEARNKINS